MALVFLLASSGAFATCLVPEPDHFSAVQISNIGLIQSGLRTVFQDDNSSLEDGRFGPDTRIRLRQLCEAFPLPDTDGSLYGTVQLAKEYGELARLAPLWFDQTSSNDFIKQVQPAEGENLNVRLLALSGPWQLTAHILNDVSVDPDCGSVDGVALPNGAQTGMLALKAIEPDRWSDAEAICADFAGPDGTEGTITALTSFGHLETSLPGSLEQILSPDFAIWLGEAITTRGPRLAGSDDAVVALVAEYRTENNLDFQALYGGHIDGCSTSSATPRVTDYYNFDQSALNQVVAPAGIIEVSDPIAELRFESAAALSKAVSDALADQISACALAQVLLAINSPDEFGRQFALNPQGAANFDNIRAFSNLKPAIDVLLGQTAKSRAVLMSDARAAITKAKSAQIAARVEVVADTLAAAAKPVLEGFDTPTERVEDQIEPMDPNRTIGVIDATDSAVAAKIEDPDFKKALLGANFAPGLDTKTLKANVRRTLAPISEAKLTQAVDSAMLQVDLIVESYWRLTSTLMDAIAVAPNIAAANRIANDPETIEALKGLIGAQYPNQRLFDAAVRSLRLETGETLLSQLRYAALRRGDHPTSQQDWYVAKPGCGCYGRREDNAAVYAFYPFWLAPETSPAAPVEAAEENLTTQKIDFDLVSRAAFYGLEFVVPNPDANPADNRVVLRNEYAWRNGQKGFVSTVHRHRAQADLAIKISGWATWEQNEINEVASEIRRLMAPFRRWEQSNWAEFKAAYPNLLDKNQADGVTLIIDGYDGQSSAAPGVEKLINLVTQLSPVLRDRGQMLNVAFDIPLTDSLDSDPLFNDVATLLVGETPLVNLVLVFLERPTFNIKKRLRARIDHSNLQGADRVDVLRRIIPVLPPTGHQNLFLQRINNGTENDEVKFNQLVDDLVYFQDNFAGVGFWPAPNPVAAETTELTRRIVDTWFNPRLPLALSGLEGPFGSVNQFVWFNRMMIATITLFVIVLTVSGIWLGLYYRKRFHQ